jgi:hypothetical protein
MRTWLDLFYCSFWLLALAVTKPANARLSCRAQMGRIPFGRYLRPVSFERLLGGIFTAPISILYFGPNSMKFVSFWFWSVAPT